MAKEYTVGSKIAWRTEISDVESGPTDDIDIMTGRVTGKDGKAYLVKGDDGDEYKVMPSWIEEGMTAYTNQISKDTVNEDHAGNLPNELEGLANQINAHLQSPYTGLRAPAITQSAMLQHAAAALKLAAKRMREIDKAADDCEDIARVH